jgi:xanthine permease XanP
VSSVAVNGGPRIRPPGLLYALDEWPPPMRLALLGVQYGFMGATYLILVAIVLRSARLPADESVDLIAIACVALGVGTVLQALPRGPVGSGFLAPPVYSATYLAPSVLAAQIGGMPLVFGMTLLAGFVEIAIALVLTRLRMIVTPVLSGLTVFVVGLQLGVVGVGQMLDVHHAAQPTFHRHLLVTVLVLAVAVGLSIWGRGAFRLLCSALALVAGMTAAGLVNLLPTSALMSVGNATWVAPPRPALLNWDFSVELAPAFVAAGLAAALRAVGVVTTCQRINDTAWQQPDMTNIRKGVLADGVANVIGGILGAPGMSIAPSLVGISKATGATSRVIAFAAAVVLFVIGLSPKLAGIFLVIPPEVAGALLVFTASFMISGGMGIMLARPVDTRSVYVIGISTLLALSENVFPAYFRDLSPFARSVTGSPLALGLAAAILLTLLFRVGTRQHADVPWTRTAASMAATLDFLRTRARDWKIGASTIATAARETEEVLAFLDRVHPRDAGGTMRLSFNGLDFGITVVCVGGHLPALPVTAPAAAAPASELDSEEAAAIFGLQDFLRSLTADRKRARQRGGRVRISLLYTV